MKKKFKSILNELDKSLDPIEKANKIRSIVKKVGFHWDNEYEVFEKVKEEIQELEEELIEKRTDKIKNELGDLIFSLIHLSEFFNIDIRDALERTNEKFVNRFKEMEKQIIKDNKNIDNLDINSLDKYWNKVKKTIEKS